MSRTMNVAVFTLACLALGLCGCMPKMTIEQMKKEMPARPAQELDRLNPFVGKWHSSGEARFEFLDQPLKFTGKNEYRWEGNHWYLVGRGVMEMEHFDPIEMIETWSYDIGSKKYRSYWTDSMGMSGASVSAYDDKADVWRMTATSYGSWGKSTMKGTMRFINPDTLEFSMSEYMGLTKVSEFKGVSNRVP